ncbi:MAG: hypothetical protein ACRCTZ_04365 [Sarcina sp.]
MKIKRLRDKRDMARKYQVYIDGELKGTLKYGEEKEFDVQEGKHEVYLKIDWCKSLKVTFVESKDKESNFECGCSLTGAKLLLAIFYVIFQKDGYLYLKKIN